MQNTKRTHPSEKNGGKKSIKSEEDLIFLLKRTRSKFDPDKILNLIDRRIEKGEIWGKVLLEIVQNKKTGAECLDRIARNEVYPEQIRISALLREETLYSTAEFIAENTKRKAVRTAARMKIRSMLRKD